MDIAIDAALGDTVVVAPSVQVVTRAPDVAVGRPLEFQTHLLACCANAPNANGCSLCCEAFWCPCCTIERNTRALELPPNTVPCQNGIGGAYCAIVMTQWIVGTILSGFTYGGTMWCTPWFVNWGAFVAAPVRDETKRRYGIRPVNCCSDSWWATLFCPWCAMVQESREHMYRQAGRLRGDRRPIVTYVQQPSVVVHHGYATQPRPVYYANAPPPQTVYYANAPPPQTVYYPNSPPPQTVYYPNSPPRVVVASGQPVNPPQQQPPPRGK